MSLLTSRECALAGSLLAALAGAWAMPAPAQQRAATPPVFSPDLSVGWIGMGEFRPVPGKVPPVTNDPKYPYVPNGQGRQPTYRIADLSNPNLKPWVTEVRIVRAADSQVRRVYLDVPHSANPKPTWYGESVGHYEGDTLVIDTIGLSTKTFVDAYRTPHTEKLHVIERWRMVDDNKFMEAAFAVEDPDAFYEPWSGMRRYRRVAKQFEEDICAENNTLLFDYQMPVANKADF